jgi:hypothetical protein
MIARHLPHTIVSLAIVAAASILLPSCHAADGTESGAASLGGDRKNEIVGADPSADDQSCSDVDCSNCVKHARCLQSALPYGLYTCADKENIINASEPNVGSVAVMNVGPDCHVGYVSDVQGSGPDAIITLDEANYHAGMCGTRSGTAADLKIVGYFQP